MHNKHCICRNTKCWCSNLVHQIYHFVTCICIIHRAQQVHRLLFIKIGIRFFLFFPIASFHIDGNTLLAIFFFLLVRTLIKYLAGIDTESFYDPNNCTRERRHGSLELISFRSHFVNSFSPLFFFFFEFLSLFAFNIDRTWKFNFFPFSLSLSLFDREYRSIVYPLWKSVVDVWFRHFRI